MRAYQREAHDERRRDYQKPPTHFFNQVRDNQGSHGHYNPYDYCAGAGREAAVCFVENRLAVGKRFNYNVSIKVESRNIPVKENRVNTAKLLQRHKPDDDHDRSPITIVHESIFPCSFVL